MNRSPRLAVIGNPVLDRVVLDGEERAPTLGGTAAYAASALCRLGARVHVVGRVGGDFPAEAWELLECGGLDLGALGRVSGECSTSYRLEYSGAEPKRTVQLLAAGPRLGAVDLPPDVGGVRALHIGAVAGEIADEMLEALLALSPRPMIGADLHLLRRFDAQGRVTLAGGAALRESLARLDVLKGSFREIRALGGCEDVTEALDRLAARETVLATDGGGAGMFLHDGLHHFEPYAVTEEVDATGAGDVFLASYLFARSVLGHAVADAVRFAAASASFVVERHGVAGLGDLDAVQQRARSIRID